MRERARTAVKGLGRLAAYGATVVTSDGARTYLPTDLAPFCNLFTGFPDLSSSKHGFSVVAEGALPPAISRISASIGWYIRRSDPDRQAFSYEPAAADLFGDVDAFPALNLDIGGRQRVVPLDRLQRRFPMRAETDATPFACVYLDPFSSRSTSQMGALWDAIALTDVEQEIVKALKIVSNDIQAVSIVGWRGLWTNSTRVRTALMRRGWKRLS